MRRACPASLACAVSVLVAACSSGGSRASGAEPSAGGAAPPAATTAPAASTHPTVDARARGAADKLVAMAALRDRACACADKACARAVMDDATPVTDSLVDADFTPEMDEIWNAYMDCLVALGKGAR